MTALDKGQLWVMRLHALGLSLVLLAAGAIGEAILRDKLDAPLGSVTLPLLLPVVWLLFFAPGRRYRAWGYRMEEDELEVHRGVLTRVETIVPLERVQHIDIAQGPVERACGVCRLIVHTAGTLHSQVVLPGLARETAETMRDAIRARIGKEEGA